MLKPIGGVEESLEWFLYGECHYVYRPDRPDLGFVGFVSQSDYEITITERNQYTVARKEEPVGEG